MPFSIVQGMWHQVSQMATKSSFSFSNPTRTAAAQRYSGLSFAGCKCDYLLQPGLSCPNRLLLSSPWAGNKGGGGLTSLCTILEEFSGSMQKIWELCFYIPPKRRLGGNVSKQLQNILNNKLILNKYVLQENDNYILHL